jgi:hypothetical protein
LAEDVFRFAVANGLRLFFDIKTKGHDDELRALARETGADRLVIEPAAFRPDQMSVPPWIEGWNYLDGGEEDPDIMAATARSAKGPRRFMVDDARALSQALNRRPDRRRLVRFADTGPEGSTLADQNPSSLDQLWQTAMSSASPQARLNAVWAIGGMRVAAQTERIWAWGTAPDEPDPARHPLGMPYFDTFRKAAAACAIVRIGEATDRRSASAALLKFAEAPGSFQAPAAALAASAFGSDETVLMLMDLYRDEPAVQQFAISHAARHPLWRQIALRAIRGDGMTARQGVFLLADSTQGAQFVADALARPAPPKVHRRLALVLRWARAIDREGVLSEIECERSLRATRRSAVRARPELGALIYPESD